MPRWAFGFGFHFGRRRQAETTTQSADAGGVDLEAKLLTDVLTDLFDNPSDDAKKAVANVVKLATKVDAFYDGQFMTSASPELRQGADTISREVDAEIDSLPKPGRGNVQAEGYLTNLAGILSKELAKYEDLCAAQTAAQAR